MTSRRAIDSSVPKQEVDSLTRLPVQFHCEICGISYGANFDQSVELRFSIHPAVRPASDQIYCIGGPLRMPYIAAQQYLRPGEQRNIAITLLSRCTLRTVGSTRQLSIISGAPNSRLSAVRVTYADGRWVPPHSLTDRGSLELPQGAVLSLRNQTGGPVLAVLEDAAWTREPTQWRGHGPELGEKRVRSRGECESGGGVRGVETTRRCRNPWCSGSEVRDNAGCSPSSIQQPARGRSPLRCGNGRSDRPSDSAAYAETQDAADALAVMNATDTAEAIIVGLSMGAQRDLLLAVEHPEPIAGACFLAPAVPLGSTPPTRAAQMKHLEEERDEEQGWAKYNRHYWERDFRGFVEFFMREIFTEPHSTQPIEDAIGWGLRDDPRVG